MLAVLVAAVPFLIIGLIAGMAFGLRGTIALLSVAVLLLAIPVLAGHDQQAAGICDGGTCTTAAWVVPAALLVAFLVPYLAARIVRHRLEHTAAP